MPPTGVITVQDSGAAASRGVIPSHQAPGARKFKFLRHEIFEWLVQNRYQPEVDVEATEDGYQ